MRSHILIRRARLSTKISSVSTRALLSCSGPARYPRNDLHSPPTKGSRIARRASTSSPNPPGTGSNIVESTPTPSKPGHPPKESTGTSNGKDESGVSTPTLPISNEQSFFWTYQSLSESKPSTLPQPEVFEEVLNNVFLSLHPQAQHKATYSTSNGPPIEPSLALYCPIEGGNYVIDDTVRELARRTGSDVVVLDAVHIAAGEWGHFGQGTLIPSFESTERSATHCATFSLAASLIELPQNPLHLPSPAPTRQSPSGVIRDDDDDDDDFPGTPHMTVQLVVPSRASRTSRDVPSKGSLVKAKTFFEMCINVQAPNDAGNSNATLRPRLVYVRDLTTLSSSWGSLHPALLSAVRQRRQGALPRSTSPVVNPTVIVFGITPPIVLPSSISPSPPGPQGLMNMLTSRSGQAAPGVATSRPGKSDWGEEDHAEKAREWRLRERLRKWERGDHTLQSELPKFPTGPIVEDEPGSPGQPDVVFVGGPGGENPFSSLLRPLLGPRPSLRSTSSNPQTSSGFLRTSVLVPASRSLSREKTSRIGRRREVNELTMRMAVGAVGGLLETRSAALVFSELAPTCPENPGPGDMTNAVKMWDDWGNTMEAWATVKQIADQAVGRVVSSSIELVRSTLSATPVSWAHVCGAWADQRASRDLRKAWIQEFSSKPAGEDQQDKNGDNGKDTHGDDIVEAVKHDPYLESHEQRLLGCIVDSGELARPIWQPSSTVRY